VFDLAANRVSQFRVSGIECDQMVIGIVDTDRLVNRR
jgi:hypothetical protein